MVRNYYDNTMLYDKPTKTILNNLINILGPVQYVIIKVLKWIDTTSKPGDFSSQYSWENTLTTKIDLKGKIQKSIFMIKNTLVLYKL